MKRNKIFKSLIVIFILLCSISILFACGDEDSDAPSTDGGSNGEGLRVIFMDGDTKLNEVLSLEEYLAYVNVPTREGYEIEGWYLDFDLTEKLVGNPSGKVTLYVNWKIKTYTVRFINYDGTAIPVNGENYQTVEHGQSAKAPEENPTREGYVFDGWDKDFSIITDNTQIRPKYSKPSYSVILYGQDGTTVVKEEVVQVGTALDSLMEDYVKYAETNTPGGFTYEGLCADKELTTVFIYPEKMPAENVVMYTKVGLQGIENVNVVSDRLDNAYRYDKEGFELTGSFSETNMAGLTYSYKWISGGVEIAGATDKILTIGVKDVGEYHYDFVVTATYGNLEPQVASASIMVTVLPGLLDRLPEEEQIGYKWGTDLVYTGKEVTPTFTNLKDGDVVYYKKSSENDYSTTSPVKNAEDNAYSIDVKVERPNYAPLVFENTSVRIKKAELTANIILGNATSQKGENSEEGNYNVYSIEYGSVLPQAEVAVSGFVNGEKQGNILKWSDENFDRTYILSTDYDQTASVLEEGQYYTLALDRATWKTPQNYTFSEASWSNVINIKVLKKSLVLRVQSRQITYGDERPADSEFETLIGAEDGTTGLPLAGFEDTIEEIVAKSYVCGYVHGGSKGEYRIKLDFSTKNTKLTEAERGIINSYDVTINEGFLIVNAKVVSIKPNDLTITYGATSAPGYTFMVVEGLVESLGHTIDVLGDIKALCNYKYDEKANASAGTYEISIDPSSITNANYEVECGTAELTVNKKQATLTLGSTSIKYYEAYPETSIFAGLLSAEGLVSWDSIAGDLAKAPRFTSSYAISQPIGEYPVIIEGYESPNYSLTLVHGTLNVEKADMTIGINDAEIVYGEAFEPKLVYTGLYGDEQDDPSLAFETVGTISGYSAGAGVGNYTLSVSGYTAKNYNIAYVNEGKATLAIIQRAITISLDKQTITYGDAEPEYTYTLTSYEEGKEVFAEGEDINTLGTLAIVAESYVGNAGHYNIVASGLTSTNYNVKYKNATLTVNVKDVTVSPENASVTYGDQVPTYTFKAEGLVNGDELSDLGTPEAVCAYQYKSNAGSYEIAIKSGTLANSNYAITLGTATLSVEKKDATLTLGTASIIYYEAYPNNNTFASLLSASGLVDGDTIANTLYTSGATFTSTYAVGSSVGEYEVVVSGYESINYDLTIENGVLDVQKRALTIGLKSAEVVYGDDIEAEWIYTGLVGEEASNPALAISNLEIVGYVAGQGIGTYPISGANATATNYTITYNTTGAQVTVVQRAITIKARDYIDEEDYWTADIANADGKVAIAGQGLYAGDSIEGSLKTSANTLGAYIATGDDIGEKFVWTSDLAITDGAESKIDNYVITYDLQVAIKTYGILVSVDEAVYDGNSYGINVTHMFEAPMAEVWYSINNVDYQPEPIEFTNAGSYTLYYKYCIYDANGEIEREVVADEPAVINITARVINLVINAETITYGDAEPEYTYTLTSYEEGKPVFAEGEDINALGSLAIVAESYVGNAGSYDLVASGLTSTNYDVKYKNATLTVKTREVTVSPENVSLTYGDQVPTYTFKVEGLADGDELSDLGTPEAVCAYQYKSNAGSYEIAIKSGTLANSNYAITLGTATLSVEKKDATLTLGTASIIYYEAYPNNNTFASLLSASGLVDGDTIANTLYTSGATFTSTYAVGSSVGEYEVVVSGYESINYDLIVVNGVLDVQKRALTIALEDADHVYGDTIAKDFVYVGLVGEEASNPALAISNLEISGYEASQGVGTYTISGANATATNYEISYVSATLTVVARKVTLTVNAQEITYGDTEPEFTYELTSYSQGKPVFAEGEDVSALGTLKIVAQGYEGNAGTYNLVAEGISSNSKYTVVINNAEYVIKRKDLTVSAKSYSISYGDAKPTFESDVVGLVKGETIASLGTQILYNCAFIEDKTATVGEYAIEPQLSLANYKITAVNGNLSVAKRAITLTASALSIFYNAEKPTLVAKSSFYGYNDDITTIGTFDIACSYVKGNDAGSYAITLANFVSDKYTATLKNGTLTVKPYETKASWSSAVSGSYVYDGSDRSSLFTATFLDVNGDEHVATITFSASNSTPNAFKNAGTYTITASTSDKNYKITDATKKVTIAKASYTSAEAHSGFTGVYSPKKTLADYALNTDYYWTVPASTPVVKTTEYDAYYNADLENYNNYPITISLVLTPALVSLSSDGATVQDAYDFAGQIDTASTNLSQTFSVSTTAYWVDENGLVEAINAGFTIRYSNGTTFGAGSHMTVMTFSSENYKLNVSDSGRIEESEGIFSTSVKYFVKFRGVEYSGTLYTPEEALNVASSGTITVKNNTSFATDSEVIARYYNTSAYTTLKSGVTFLIPYSVDDTKGNLEGGEKDASDGNYNAHPTVRCNEATPVLYLTVTIPACSTLNVNGTLIVGALTGSTVTGTYQNGITGNYSRILLEGNIVATAGTVKVFGYVLGSGKITASGSAEIIENMYLTGWSGGTVSSVKYLGSRTLSTTKFVLTGGDVSYDDPKAFAFNEYELRAVQTRMEINYGASLKGFIKIATSEQSYDLGITTYTIKAKISTAQIAIVSSGTGDNGGILELSSGAKVTKTMANDRVRLELEGSVSDGYGTMVMPVLKANVQLKTANVLFPIDGRTDVVVKSGSTFTQDYKFKLLPGATLTVEAGATYNVNGSTIVYNDNYYDFDGHPKPYTQGRGDARLIVNGTMNVNGAFGGNVISTGAGKVVVASGATLSVYSYEIQTGKIARDGVSIVTTATEGNSQTLAMTIGGATAVAGTTYNYNGTAWA